MSSTARHEGLLLGLEANITLLLCLSAWEFQTTPGTAFPQDCLLSFAGSWALIAFRFGPVVFLLFHCCTHQHFISCGQAQCFHFTGSVFSLYWSKEPPANQLLKSQVWSTLATATGGTSSGMSFSHLVLILLILITEKLNGKNIIMLLAAFFFFFNKVSS